MTEAPSVAVIANPQSGGGKTGRILDSLVDQIRRRVGECDLLRTEYRGHASILAAEHGSHYKKLVIVGGDGTTNEVVDGVMRALSAGKRTPFLGLLPQGTGGDFRRSFFPEHRLDRYLDAIAGEESSGVDIGRASFMGHDGSPCERYFANVLSMGMSGLVDQFVDGHSNLLGGKASYYLASLKALQKSRLGHLRIRALGGDLAGVDLRSRMLAICNGRYFGGGMDVAPMASPSDGVFEVVSLGEPNRMRFALQGGRIYSGKHLELSSARHFRASSLEVELLNADAAPFLLDVDGEALGQLPLKVELIPKAVRVLVNKPG